MALTDKQVKFINEYMIDMNATAAYQRAGYTAEGNSAEASACRLLRNVKIQQELNIRQQKMQEEAGLSVQWVLDKLRTIAERCMQAEAVLDREGNPTGEYKFDSSGANKAVENIGKHFSMFKDKVEHSGNMGVTIVNDIPRNKAK